MELKKRVKSAYLFDNGNLAVFDYVGQQIPELQGTYSIDRHKRILLEAMDDCDFKGFYQLLPPGFISHAKDYADYFRDKNLSWNEIAKL